jgi:hypothetical protein
MFGRWPDVHLMHTHSCMRRTKSAWALAVLFFCVRFVEHMVCVRFVEHRSPEVRRPISCWVFFITSCKRPCDSVGCNERRQWTPQALHKPCTARCLCFSVCNHQALALPCRTTRCYTINHVTSDACSPLLHLLVCFVCTGTPGVDLVGWQVPQCSFCLCASTMPPCKCGAKGPRAVGPLGCIPGPDLGTKSPTPPPHCPRPAGGWVKSPLLAARYLAPKAPDTGRRAVGK